MLFKMLATLNDRIRSIDHQRDAAAFAEEMVRRSAPVLRQLKVKGEPTPSQKAVLWGMGAFVLDRLIEPLSEVIDELTEVAKNRKVPAAIRCAVVGSLAYTVKPDDLIPDDAPGGYGFVDDALILYATEAAYLNKIGRGEAAVKEYEVRAGLASSILPPDVAPLLDQGVSQTIAAFDFFSQVPAQILEQAIERLIQNPDLAQVPGIVPPGAGASAGKPRQPRYPLLDSPILVQENGVTMVTLPGGEVLMS